MKIVLNPHEVNEIIVEYLMSKGKLENKETDVCWRMYGRNIETLFVEIEQ